MKIKFLLLILLTAFFSELFSQTYQWRLLTESPGFTGSGRNEDIYFINQNTGWCVGYDGEVYSTTNGGNHWQTTFVSTFGSQFRSVGFFDSTSGILGTLINDSNKILYRTTNSGFNWTPVSNISGKRPQGICGISIVNENVAYACGRYYLSARIIKTTDKGISWSLVFNDSSLARTLIDCYFWTADSGIAVGGYSTGNNFDVGNAVIIKTTNGGVSWQRVHKTTRTGEWCWKISFVSRDIGFVSIEREFGFAYILKTTDNGSNWIDIPFRTYDEEGIGFINENTGWLGGWTGPTYQTTNGGATWQLAGWGTNLNRFRFFGDTLGYAVGDRIYKYSRGPVEIQSISENIPEKFSLEQNYPNPFNPVTKIKFDIPSNVKSQTSNVKLLIYDALGKEMSTLVNEKLSPGSYEAEFNPRVGQGSSFSSGIYFYSLIINEKMIDTKSMVLIK